MSEIPDDILSVPNQNSDSSKRVLIITTDKTEDLEFFYPYYRFIEEGYNVDVAIPEGPGFKGKMGYKFLPTLRLEDVHAGDYDLLYIPGGKAPEKLKGNDDALELTRDFVNLKKPVAALCHGPQLLAAADVIRGAQIAAWPEVADEITKAGAHYVNVPTMVSNGFITARWPADLPSHLAHTLGVLKQKTAQSKKSAA